MSARPRVSEPVVLVAVLSLLTAGAAACRREGSYERAALHEIKWGAATEPANATTLGTVLAVLRLADSEAVEALAMDTVRGGRYAFARVLVGHGISWSQSAYYALGEAKGGEARVVWSGLAEEHAAPDTFLPVRPYWVAACLYLGNGPTLAYYVVASDTGARRATADDTLLRESGYYRWTGGRFRFDNPADSALAQRCRQSTKVVPR